jgi:hypothetical protein
MRKKLPHGRTRLGRPRSVSWRNEIADRIAERQRAFLDATQHHRRREHLRETVELKWRVGSGRNRSLEVLPTERALPEDGVVADDGSRESRDASLQPERLHVIAKPLQARIFRSLWRMAQQRERSCYYQQKSAHVVGRNQPS